MLSGTDCGLLLLLLLLGGLDVALAVNAFPRLAPLALRAVPLLVILLATNRTLVVLVPTVPLCFHSRSLDTVVRSCLSAALPWNLVPAVATDLASSRVAICRRAASLAPVTAWSRRCWSMMLNSASGSCTTRLNLVSLSTLRRTSSGSIPAGIPPTSTLPSSPCTTDHRVSPRPTARCQQGRFAGHAFA